MMMMREFLLCEMSFTNALNEEEVKNTVWKGASKGFFEYFGKRLDLREANSMDIKVYKQNLDGILNIKVIRTLNDLEYIEFLFEKDSSINEDIENIETQLNSTIDVLVMLERYRESLELGKPNQELMFFGDLSQVEESISLIKEEFSKIVAKRNYFKAEFLI